MQILNNVKVLNQSPRMAKKMKPKWSHNKPIMIPNNMPRKYSQKTRLMVLREVWVYLYTCKECIDAHARIWPTTNVSMLIQNYNSHAMHAMHGALALAIRNFLLQ